MSEVILGLNAFHGDSAACLVVDGKLVAAAEEERFRRLKHWAGFPSEAAKYCLASAGMTALGVVVVAWVAGRIYRVGILMYGKRATIPEIFRWIRTG